MHVQLLVLGGVLLNIICFGLIVRFLEIKKRALKKMNDALLKVSDDNKALEDKLEFEMQFIDTVLNCLPGIFYMYDHDGNLIRWNTNYQMLNDCNEIEISLKKVFHNIADESLDKAKEVADEVFVNNNAYEAELLLLDQSCRKIPFNCTVAPLKSHGKTFLVGVGIDISQRKQAEEEQFQSEERLRLAAEATELGTWYLDLMTGSFRWSERCYVIFGLQPGTPMNYEFFLSCLHPDDRERTHAAVMAALDPVNTHEYDIEYRSIWHSDGSVHWISAKGRGFFEEVDGKLKATRMNGTTLDITPRVLAVEALRESERKYRSLFLVEPDALILIDRESLSILEANQSALNLYGYDREVFLTLDVLSISSDSREDRSIFLSFNDDQKSAIQSYHKRKDGSLFPVEVSGCAFDLCGRTVIYLAIRDITERKLMEKELEAARKELEFRVEERTSELTSVNIRLQQEINEHKQTEEELQVYQQKLLDLSAELSLAEEKERRRIAAELHDDIGQTLAMVRIKTESLMMSSLHEELVQSIGVIRDLIVKSIQKVRSLTSQLSPPLLYEVGFGAALRWLGDKFQLENGLQVDILGDPVRKELGEEVAVTLFQVVRELLMNISKHAKANNATIMICMDKRKILINVMDDGIGFDVARVGKKDEFGLFNIRQKMRHLSGEITFESKIGKGTNVCLMAPFKIREDGV